MTERPLRIVTFNYNPIVFNICRDWILRNGHKHLLAVTTPGPKSRPTPAYKEILANAPREVDVLSSTRMKTVVTPVIRALEPDLIFCLSFPYRLSAELCAIPKIGAVNVHPAPLPAHRGPNMARVVYDGGLIGAAMHWIAPEFDTGNLLSVKSAQLPDELSFETVFPIWAGLMAETIEEGMERAIAGDVGEAQDESQASYAAKFSEGEYQLNLNDTIRGLQEKIFALQLNTSGDIQHPITIQLNGNVHVISSLVATKQTSAEPVGTCLELGPDTALVKVKDGVARFALKTE